MSGSLELPRVLGQLLTLSKLRGSSPSRSIHVVPTRPVVVGLSPRPEKEATPTGFEPVSPAPEDAQVASVAERSCPEKEAEKRSDPNGI